MNPSPSRFHLSKFRSVILGDSDPEYRALLSGNQFTSVWRTGRVGGSNARP